VSEPVANDFFALPPFDAGAALTQLQRTLRAIGGLAPRGEGFEWKGRAVVALALDGAQLQVRLARRPAMSPDWEARTLKNGADVRRFADDVKERVARWKDADE